MSDYPHTPGSDAAVADGCICPVMDNAHGKGCGYTTEDGERFDTFRMYEVTPFVFGGFTIVGVAPHTILAARGHEPAFSLYGTAWDSGLYSRSQLVACGASEADLDAIFSAGCEEHDRLVGRLA